MTDFVPLTHIPAMTCSGAMVFLPCVLQTSLDSLANRCMNSLQHVIISSRVSVAENRKVSFQTTKWPIHNPIITSWLPIADEACILYNIIGGRALLSMGVIWQRKEFIV